MNSNVVRNNHKPVNSRNRKILAATAGLIFILVGVVIAWVGQFFVASIGDSLFAIQAIPGWSIPQHGSDFYALFVLGLCVAAGLSVTSLHFHYKSFET